MRISYNSQDKKIKRSYFNQQSIYGHVQEDIQIGNRQMKKFLNIISYLEMYIKTTMKFLPTPINMVMSQSTRDNRCW